MVKITVRSVKFYKPGQACGENRKKRQTCGMSLPIQPVILMVRSENAILLDKLIY
jgi:hypothetical protein